MSTPRLTQLRTASRTSDHVELLAGEAGVGKSRLAREAERLAQRLACGLSNKAIAARLYLSPKTIEKHVASLIDKLAVRSRAQLAAIATAAMGDAAKSTWEVSRTADRRARSNTSRG